MKKQIIKYSLEFIVIVVGISASFFVENIREEIEKDSDRDNWMTATQAKEYGLVDEVLTRDNVRKKNKA